MRDSMTHGVPIGKFHQWFNKNHHFINHIIYILYNLTYSEEQFVKSRINYHINIIEFPFVCV